MLCEDKKQPLIKLYDRITLGQSSLLPRHAVALLFNRLARQDLHFSI